VPTGDGRPVDSGHFDPVMKMDLEDAFKNLEAYAHRAHQERLFLERRKSDKGEPNENRDCYSTGSLVLKRCYSTNTGNTR